MKGHVERKHPEKMDNERKEDHKKKNPKSKIETPAVQNFQFTPIASPTPIYLVVPDDLTLENAHQPNFFLRCQDKQGVQYHCRVFSITTTTRLNYMY